VILVGTDVSEELIASITRVKRISDLETSAFLRSVLQLLVTANVVPSSQIVSTLIMEDTRSSETSVLTRTKRRNIPKDGILHSHRRENLKSYI
jgi:hypothetical protein